MENQKTEILIGREFARQVIPLIKNAKKSIDIIVYNWLWYPNEIGSKIQNFNHAIIVANRGGIEVKAVVQKTLIAEILRREKVKVRKIQSGRVLHTKLMIIDDSIAIVGSHNYTMNAFNINYEVSVIIHEQKIVKDLKKYFSNFFY
jgi:phosphatidylserine/phosphatidylglycerophosphate/cardiolipin synthase-like enzyme